LLSYLSVSMCVWAWESTQIYIYACCLFLLFIVTMPWLFAANWCTISRESEPKCNVEHCTYAVVCYVWLPPLIVCRFSPLVSESSYYRDQTERPHVIQAPSAWSSSPPSRPLLSLRAAAAAAAAAGENDGGLTPTCYWTNSPRDSVSDQNCQFNPLTTVAVIVATTHFNGIM